jgi:hypothetical protein
LIKRTTQKLYIKIVNIYAPNIDTSNFIKETLLDIKAWIDPNIVMMSDLNTLLSSIDSSSRESKSTKKLQN